MIKLKHVEAARVVKATLNGRTFEIAAMSSTLLLFLSPTLSPRTPPFSGVINIYIYIVRACGNMDAGLRHEVLHKWDCSS